MSSTHVCHTERPCPIPIHPDALQRREEQARNVGHAGDQMLLPGHISNAHENRPLGFNDGAIFPESQFPPNTRRRVINTAAQQQPPPQGPLKVIVVLVNFADQTISSTAQQDFKDLFFSKGKIKTKSVTEYYQDVSGGKVSIVGTVTEPLTLPKTKADYGHGAHGMGDDFPNTRTMADDALTALIKTGKYPLEEFDNKVRAEGWVDAFIVVHPGTGGEEEKDINDIWSCKWVLPEAREVGNTKVYPFLTIPEDAKLGVCAHEIGHLIFGWPDLYDIKDNTKAGVGNWCLMGGGSWGSVDQNAPGTTPCQPSAWCKIQQGWVNVIPDQTNLSVWLNDVKANPHNTVNANRFGNVHRLWSNGADFGNEYFLIENRAQTGFDASLPGEGLLIWHVDESMLGNDANGHSGSNDSVNNPHYRVALMNASGQAALGGSGGRGDASNVFPGTTNKKEFSVATNPTSRSYAGQDTFVAVKNISGAGRTMRMDISVTQTRLSKL